MPVPVVASVSPREIQHSLGRELAKAFGKGHAEAVDMADRSLAKALAVLKIGRASCRERV